MKLPAVTWKWLDGKVGLVLFHGWRLMVVQAGPLWFSYHIFDGQDFQSHLEFTYGAGPYTLTLDGARVRRG